MSTINIDGLGTDVVYNFFTSFFQVISADAAQFVLKNVAGNLTLTVTGSSFSYGNTTDNLLTGGTITGVKLAGTQGSNETWSGFSVSALEAYNALKTANAPAFYGLFFGGDDTINVTGRPSTTVFHPTVYAGGGGGTDTINFSGNNFISTGQGGIIIQGSADGADIVNLTAGLQGSIDPYSPPPRLGLAVNLSVQNIKTVNLAPGFDYTIATNGYHWNSNVGIPLTIDGSRLGAGDQMIVGTGIYPDILTAGGGARGALVLLGGAGDDIFQGSGVNDTFNGGAGSDTVSFMTFRNGSTGVTVDLSLSGAQTIAALHGNDTFISIENLIGSISGDTLKGDANSNFLFGGGDNDHLFGGGGDDTLDGGGNGQFFSDGSVLWAGLDTLDGGAGNDTASFQRFAGSVSVSLAIAGAQSVSNGQKYSLTAIENLLGSDYADTLAGDAGNNVLNGGGNIDTAVFRGNRAAYSITKAGSGQFTVSGPDGADTLLAVEYARFDDQTVRLLPGDGVLVDFNAAPAGYMGAIRDFDGNDLGAGADWKLIGTASVAGGSDTARIYVNPTIGRWAEVTAAPDGKVYFEDHGWAGVTRVVGIYIDPLVQSGAVVAGSDHDSQRRFQNDLKIDNIGGVLGAADYDHDGLQEVYFRLTDATAYLHAYMHADGNIRYANYQSQQQVKDYLTANGFGAATWANWFPIGETPSVPLAGPDFGGNFADGGHKSGILAAVAG